MKRAAISMLLIVVGLLPCIGVHAQVYPIRPIRLIVPNAPGGTSDLIGRIVGQRLAEGLGTTVVIDNRGGAGGTLGAALAARAEPDGYTLFVTHIGLAVNETLYTTKPYSALKDLMPISRVGHTPCAVVATVTLPARTMGDLIALAKKQPGKLNAGSGGSGSASDLAVVLLENMSGTTVTHIPFKGGAPAVVAAIAGQVDFAIPIYPTIVSYLKAGKLRILAVTGARREKTAPDVPTVSETIPGYEFTIWFAMYAPSGTPKTIVTRLNRELVKGLAEADTREKLARAGVNAESSSSEDLERYLRAEVAKWAKIIKAAGIQVN